MKPFQENKRLQILIAVFICQTIILTFSPKLRDVLATEPYTTIFAAAYLARRRDGTLRSRSKERSSSRNQSRDTGAASVLALASDQYLKVLKVIRQFF